MNEDFCILLALSVGSTVFLLVVSVGQRLCIDFLVHVLVNFLTTLRSHTDVTCSCYFWSSSRMNEVDNYTCSFSPEKTEPHGYTVFLLSLYVGPRLCINFSVPVLANFVTTLRSHLDVHVIFGLV